MPAPLTARQSKLVGWVSIIVLVQLLIGIFPFTNSVLIEGGNLRYLKLEYGYELLGILLLSSFDLAIALVFWWGLVKIAQGRDGAVQKWSGWINWYKVYCVSGLLKIGIVEYLLFTDQTGQLANPRYLKVSSFLYLLVPTVYVLGTWWLSGRRPDQFTRLFKWFVGLRCAHWFDPEPLHDRKSHENSAG